MGWVVAEIEELDGGGIVFLCEVLPHETASGTGKKMDGIAKVKSADALAFTMVESTEGPA